MAIIDKCLLAFASCCDVNIVRHFVKFSAAQKCFSMEVEKTI